MIFLRKYSQQQELLDEKIFLKTEDLAKAIFKISSRDLKNKTLTVFSDDEDLKSFFETKFNPEFYEFKNSQVFLLYLENGKKRSLRYKVNDEKVFKKVLERIETSVENAINEIFGIKVNIGSEVEDAGSRAKRIIWKIKSSEINGEIITEFDLNKWTYKIVKAEIDYPDTILRFFKQAFSYNTSAVKASRKKKNENKTK
jgi:hypothetical protein